jgi:hypothetical protein
MSILCNFFSLVSALRSSFAKHTVSNWGLLGNSPRGVTLGDVVSEFLPQGSHLERRLFYNYMFGERVIERARFGDDRMTACL